MDDALGELGMGGPHLAHEVGGLVAQLLAFERGLAAGRVGGGLTGTDAFDRDVDLAGQEPGRIVDPRASDISQRDLGEDLAGVEPGLDRVDQPLRGRVERVQHDDPLDQVRLAGPFLAQHLGGGRAALLVSVLAFLLLSAAFGAAFGAQPVPVVPGLPTFGFFALGYLPFRLSDRLRQPGTAIL
ncbi:hypothetical protein [Kutzneria sp. 744]|uniref:hypothetical protein n=1 Tax=Kutzneria sp. (strain 744) TaxID=345341 RepID=UPI0018DC946C|nr:hypothetical protein [Kutzneria sp. 744]